ncbi:hypothetical protein B7Y94_02915 [Candidatus Saccharibacteria bacterium 32-49-12]|nr:MAG: hypothetical protein B7Y94_02915 [Candidatus Saccharibacteria bacterium 32-49-12]
MPISKRRTGFTIVEVVVVIAIISFIATVIYISYTSTARRAENSAISNSIQSAKEKLELYKIETGQYPDSVADCPTPAANNTCLNIDPKFDVLYNLMPTSRSGYASRIPIPSYELAIMGNRSFIYFSPAIVEGGTSGTSEFLQYTDFAPYIDRYGLRKYLLSVDYMSKNTSSASNINLYFQNGSTTRYGGLSKSQAAATTWRSTTVEFTATSGNTADTQAIFAAYGTYSTGNVPVLRNVELTIPR